MKELEQEGEERSTTRFNLAELYVGVFRARSPDREQALLDHLCAGMTILDFEASAAILFGRITAYLQMVGRPAGDMDVLIAAVAIANGQRLITRNIKHALTY